MIASMAANAMAEDINVQFDIEISENIVIHVLLQQLPWVKALLPPFKTLQSGDRRGKTFSY